MTRYDLLFRKDGQHDIRLHPVLDCNWFRAMENSMATAHLQVLHQEFIGGGRAPVNTPRGYTDDVESFEFYVTEFGLMKKRTYKNGTVDEHSLVFPSILRQGASTQLRTPIDDTHTWHVYINFHPTEDGSEPEDAFEPKVEDMGPYKQPPEAMHPQAHFTMHHVIPQDHMEWETQGPLADRSIEHLSYSDRGVVLLLRVLKEQIEKVQRGDDPLGVQRGENPPMINTNIDEGWFAKGFRQAMAEKPAAG
jgi:5,5'-dehydrodivanillate O-demethylase